ncbi:hypothetical protein ABW19_dt0209173 [Dactylella cylindrospora]|nr:hypothetical protein ABW19_dt0209173 [Dactylella cylindrospora]
MSKTGRRTILLLGAPTASILQTSNDRLLSYPTPPFEPELSPSGNSSRIEDYLGPGTLPSLSSFDPNSTTRISDEQVDDAAERADGEGKPPVSSGRLKPIPVPAWRILPLRRPSLHTGFTQREYDPTPSMYAWKERCEASFASDGTTVPDESQLQAASSLPIPLSPSTPHLSLEDADTQSTEPNSSFLLERSYAVHNLPSSQVPPLSSSPPISSGEGGQEITTFDETTFYEEDTLPPPLPPIPIAKVTDLEDLPAPRELLNPKKTRMATILVGIMKAESQIIKTKFTNELNPSGEVELITFTVGDYTTSGLQVKIWLPLPKSPANGQGVQQAQVHVPTLTPGLAKCRYFTRGDIVLFQDLALSAFRGVVYASSLRRDRTRAMLVYRERKGYRADLSDPVDATVEKVRRIREWVRCYVGHEEDGGDDDTRESL